MKANDKLIMIVNYLFIFLAINYRKIIVRFITQIDSVGLLLSFFSIVVVFLNINKFKLLLRGKPIIFWFLWCIYAFFNYYLHPHTNISLSFFGLYYKIFIPLIVMTVVVIEYERNTVGLLWICLITHVTFMAAGYFFDSGILFRDLGKENVLGNAYAIISSFTLFYLVLLNRLKRIPSFVFLVLAFLIIFVLAMSGTRKAFGAGLLMLAFWGFSLLDMRRVRSWILLGVLIAVGLWGYNYFMENTFMGARMEYLEEQQESYLPDDAPKVLGLFGNRAPHYYYGWDIFLEHPVFGVGTGQGRVEESINLITYIHSEYMAQLVDGGLVGFLLFISFFLLVVVRVLRCQSHNSAIGRCMLGGVAVLSFLYLTAWAWEFPRYFICLGVLIGYGETNKMENKPSISLKF